MSQGELAADHPETLARISAHLTTTARAWDRLPAVVSNRTGRTARLELWIKRSLKKFSRWFTWEQINFNSAVHNALVDAVQELSAQRQELSAQRHELSAQRQELASLRDKLSQRERQLQTLGSAIDEQARKQAGQQARIQAAEQAAEARLANLASELRDRNEQLSAEQRVCFRQLSLEMSEAKVMEDRGRRAIESRLEKLEGKSPNEHE